MSRKMLVMAIITIDNLFGKYKETFLCSDCNFKVEYYSEDKRPKVNGQCPGCKRKIFQVEIM